LLYHSRPFKSSLATRAFRPGTLSKVADLQLSWFGVEPEEPDDEHGSEADDEETDDEVQEEDSDVTLTRNLVTRLEGISVEVAKALPCLTNIKHIVVFPEWNGEPSEFDFSIRRSEGRISALVLEN
jgi:hypothetical protein